MTIDPGDKKRVLDFIKYFRKVDFKKKVEIFRFAEKHGIHITPEGFYSPVPSISKLDKKYFSLIDEIHFDWNESFQIELLKKFGEYSKEFESLVKDGSFPYENGSFSTHDAPIYYAMIRHFKPRKIIEVGVGNSTFLGSLNL